jgi:hypothetical protein
MKEITEAGVLLRSDLGTFQLNGHDVKLFVNEILPLLDGTHDKEAVASTLEGFSHQSMLAFLDLLEQYGLLENVSSVPEAPGQQDRWRGQKGFFQKWMDQPEEAARRLGDARVLKLELLYWIAREHWNRGLATEIAQELVRYGFEELEFSEVWASMDAPSDRKTRS